MRLAEARNRYAWRALSALFCGGVPDYHHIALQMRGYSLEELRRIVFEDVAPVCGINLMTAAPSVWTAFDDEWLVSEIQSLRAGRSASPVAALGQALKSRYLRLYFRDLWRKAEIMFTRYRERPKPSPQTLAILAHKAALMEVGASPKPGLVCPDHNGAHTDMDYPLFVASADALLPYFEECASIGRDRRADAPDAIFPLLRKAGVRAEKAMFAATNGVNTHKGLIFSMGLAVAAAGRLAGQNRPVWPDPTASEAASFVKGIVARDLHPLRASLPNRPLTAGERLFLEHGAAGIRQEAESGFPSALGAFYRLYYMYGGMPLEKALPHILLWIIATTTDTNILSRGGMPGLEYARQSAATVLDLGGMATKEGRAGVLAMRDAFVARNLSPGGSADILALAAFFWLLQHHEED